jgi:hypothetical protein
MSQFITLTTSLDTHRGNFTIRELLLGPAANSSSVDRQGEPQEV